MSEGRELVGGVDPPDVTAQAILALELLEIEKLMTQCIALSDTLSAYLGELYDMGIRHQDMQASVDQVNASLRIYLEYTQSMR